MQPDAIESEIPCAVCGSHAVDVVADTDRDGRPLRNVLCRECGLVWVDPRPTGDQLRQFYAEQYRSSYKGAAEPKKKHCYREMLRANQRVARLRERYRPGDRLLDVGAGAGFFSYVLAASGVDYQGIEPNSGYSGFARERLGLERVRVGFLEEVEDFDSYDIITINHVFEHLPDPNAALSHMHRLLRDRGQIIMEVPSVLADYHAPNKVFHVGHLYWYDTETLSAMALKHGFEVADVQIVPDTAHVNMVMRKLATPPAADWRAAYAGNYPKVRRFFDRRSLFLHYLSGRPYSRFLRKMATYLHEYRYVKRFEDKLGLIESVPREKV